MEKMKQELRDQIEITQNDLADSRIQAQDINTRVFDLETNLSRLQAALDALEGKSASFSADLNKIPVTKAEDVKGGGFAWSKCVTLNGEPIVLEPGFHIAKNSLGEECIVPDGVEHTPMSEPEKPSETRIAFPEVNDGFTRPEDLL